jgi:XTP/dITP diphosphohydrolase
MQPCLLATNNAGKVAELLDLLPGFSILTPRDAGIDLDVVEDGSTYAENAARKAVAFCRASGLVTLADDSGLEVDALGGAPGLHSARYSPLPGANDADRRALLLQNLQTHPRPWTAHFHATVAIATPQGELYTVEGNCPGEIISEERGEGGFGYDCIFLLAHLGKTMAELSRAEKNTLSHRALAVKAALPILQNLLAKGL